VRIASVASAFPDNLYEQEAITAALKQYWGGNLERPGLLERVHANAGVRRRHLAFPMERYLDFVTWGDANRAWQGAAENLGERAIDAALERAELRRGDLDALYFVSITGVSCPSLDARLINRMGLRPDLRRTPMFGLGCVGGAVGLSRAADYVRAHPAETAALLSVELCSLTMRRDDISSVNLIATGLFADGAVAAILTGAGRVGDGPEILDHRSIFYPGTEDLMGWDISEKGFRVVLSRRLPEFIRCRLASDVDRYLAGRRLTRRDVGSWVIHPGGPKVLEAVECALGLESRELEASWDCLARFGNLSSGSVLNVLEHVMTERRPDPGTLGIVMAMGPGFCSEVLLIRW
jgi:alkylresorcinol/alkylpyrone synthase